MADCRQRQLSVRTTINSSTEIIMSHIDKINTLLQELGRRDGIAGLQLGPDGAGGLELRNGVRLYFEYTSTNDTLFLYSPIHSLPQDSGTRLELLEVLLHSNFALISGGSIAVVEHLDAAVYCVPLRAEDLTVDQLDRSIDELLKARALALSQVEYLLHSVARSYRNKNPINRRARHSRATTLRDSRHTVPRTLA
jgi:hypothetical protein